MPGAGQPRNNCYTTDRCKSKASRPNVRPNQPSTSWVLGDVRGDNLQQSIQANCGAIQPSTSWVLGDVRGDNLQQSIQSNCGAIQPSTP